MKQLHKIGFIILLLQKRHGILNNLSKVSQPASSTAKILTYVYQTIKPMSNVSHSIPLLKLSISPNHRGCWRLLWHMVGPEMVCPGFSQMILILFLPIKLGCELFLTPAVFFLPSALLLIVILVSTSKYIHGFHSMQFSSLLLTSSSIHFPHSSKIAAK